MKPRDFLQPTRHYSGMRGVLLFAVLAAACDSNDGPVVLVDAPPPDYFPDPYKDAPFTCTPVAPRGPPPACLALAPDAIRGNTPFGTVDLALDYFGAGDCITISSATIAWRGACGEVLTVSFPYPVMSDGMYRKVVGNFSASARFYYEPPGMPRLDDTTTIDVGVAKWQEGDGVHDIDITLTVPADARYAIAPLRVVGTFCDWAYLLC